MDINRNALIDYRERSGWDNDEKTFYTADGKYCIFFYNISEVRMSTYFSTFAVFRTEDLQSPLITMNANRCRTWYRFRDPFFYAPASDLIVTVYGSDLQKKLGESGMPYLLIKPSEQKYAVIPFDFTSMYYGIEERAEDVLELTELSPREIDRCVAIGKHIRQTGRIISTKDLNWYPLERLQEIDDICKQITLDM